jgi:hypothetical protein
VMLLSAVRRVLECAAFAVLAMWIFLATAHALYGEAPGKDSAGGGAAIGMFTLFLIRPVCLDRLLSDVGGGRSWKVDRPF